MIDLITRHINDISSLCRTYCVKRLEVFGSAATGEFDPDSSDVDFAVEFFHECTMNAFNQYIDFLLGLEDMLGRKVDLVELSAVNNPYFRTAIENTREVIYDASIS